MASDSIPRRKGTYIVNEITERDGDIPEGDDDIGPDGRVFTRLEDLEKE
jgi:hypothetical protein